MRINDALAMYLEQLAANGRSLHTIAQAKRHVMALARWTDKPLRDVSHQDAARFLIAQQNGRSAATVNAFRSSLRTFFAYCEAAEYVQRSPARLVQRARVDAPPPRGLSEAEQERLVEALNRAESWEERRDRALFMTMLGTGIRLSSALALTANDVDLDAGVVQIRAKGNVHATLPVSDQVRERLANWMPDAGPTFPSRSGAPLSSRQAQARFASWCKQAGVRAASPHSLRHSFAMGLLRRTGNLSIVQRALCHRSVLSTVVYARADERAVRAALGNCLSANAPTVCR